MVGRAAVWHRRLPYALYKPTTGHVSARASVPPISANYQSFVAYGSTNATPAPRRPNARKYRNAKGTVQQSKTDEKGSSAATSGSTSQPTTTTQVYPKHYDSRGSQWSGSSAAQAGIPLDKNFLSSLFNREAYNVLEDVAAGRIRAKLDIDTYIAMCETCCRLVEPDSKDGFSMSWGEAREKILNLLHIADTYFDRQTGEIIPLLAAGSKLCAERGDLLAVVRIFNRAGQQGIYFCNALFHGLGKAIRRSTVTLTERDVLEVRRLCNMLRRNRADGHYSDPHSVGLSFPAAKDLLGALAEKTETSSLLLSGLWMDAISLMEPKYANTRTLNEVLNFMKNYCTDSMGKKPLLSHDGPASSTYRMFMSQGVEPDDITLNTMMSIASKERSVTSASTTLAAAKEKGFGVSSRMVTSLMTLFLQEEDYIPLFRLYQLAVSCGAWDAGLNFRFIAGPLRRNRIDVSLSALRVASICSHLNTYGELPPTLDREHMQLKREELIQHVEEKENQKRYAEYLRTVGSDSSADQYMKEMIAKADAELARARRQVREYIPSKINDMKSARQTSVNYTDEIISLVEEVAHPDTQDEEVHIGETPIQQDETAMSSEFTPADELDNMLQNALCAPVAFEGALASCNALLDAFGRLSIPHSQFNRFLDWMHQASIQRDRSTYKYIIRYFIRHGQERTAIEYLQQAQKNGNCDKELVSTTFYNLLRLGKTTSCLDILERELTLDQESSCNYSGSLLTSIVHSLSTNGRRKRECLELLDRTCNYIGRMARDNAIRSLEHSVPQELGENFRRAFFHSVLRRDGNLSYQLYDRLRNLYLQLGITDKLQCFRPFVTDALVANIFALCNSRVDDAQSVGAFQQLLNSFVEFCPRADDQSIEQQVYLSQSVSVLRQLLDTWSKFPSLVSSGIADPAIEILNNSVRLAVVHDFEGGQPKQRIRSLIDVSSKNAVSTAPYTMADVVSPRCSELFHLAMQCIGILEQAESSKVARDRLQEVKDSLQVINASREGESRGGQCTNVDPGSKDNNSLGYARLAEANWCHHVGISQAIRGGYIWEAGRLASRQHGTDMCTTGDLDIMEVLGSLVKLHLNGESSDILDSLRTDALPYNLPGNLAPIANTCLEIAGYNRAYTLYWKVLEMMERAGIKDVSDPALEALRVSANDNARLFPIKTITRACRLRMEFEKSMQTTPSPWALSNLMVACFRHVYDYGDALSDIDTVRADLNTMAKSLVSTSNVVSPVSKNPADVFHSLDAGDHVDWSQETLWRIATLLYRMNSSDSFVWDRLMSEACNLASPEKVAHTFSALMESGYHPSEEVLKKLELLFVRNELYDEAYFVDMQRSGRTAHDHDQDRSKIDPDK